jgi:hypothetical protein
MSYELHVGLRRADLPNVKAWQAAINALGHPLKLDEFSWDDHSGFLPAQLSGHGSGFELYLETAQSIEPPTPLAPQQDAVVTFRTGGRMEELKSATFAADALVQRFGGSAWDDYSEEVMSNGSWAACVDEARAAGD